MTESLLQLSQFTTSGDIRDFTKKVTKIGDYLGVCTGHYLIVDITTKGKHYGFYDFHEERKKHVSDYKLESQLQAIQKGLNNFEWSDMPVIKPEHYRICDSCNERGKKPAREVGCAECKGSGQVELENDYNSYEVNCKSCDGDGNEFAGGMVVCDQCNGLSKHLHYVPVLKANEDWAMNGQYVQLFKDLPNIKLSWHESYGYFVFKFSGGFGLVMPMRT